MRWLSRLRRWMDRRKQPQVRYLNEYEWMLLVGGMNYRDKRLQHNAYRNG